MQWLTTITLEFHWDTSTSPSFLSSSSWGMALCRISKRNRMSWPAFVGFRAVSCWSWSLRMSSRIAYQYPSVSPGRLHQLRWRGRERSLPTKPAKWYKGHIVANCAFGFDCWSKCPASKFVCSVSVRKASLTFFAVIREQFVLGPGSELCQNELLHGTPVSTVLMFQFVRRVCTCVLTFGLILSRMKCADLYIHWFCSASAERAFGPLEVLSIERPEQGQTLVT